MPGKYKLTYFGFPGRGEVIRLLFHAGKQEFEDYRITKEEWAKLQSSVPGGQLPFLDTPETKPGKPLTQSTAIARHLAIKFKLYPLGNETKMYQVERAVETCKDIFSGLERIMMTPDDKKDSARKEYIDGKLVAHIGELQRLAEEETGGPFFTGNEISLADYFFVAMIPTLKMMLAGLDIREKFPFVKKHYNAVVAKSSDAANKYMAQY